MPVYQDKKEMNKAGRSVEKQLILYTPSRDEVEAIKEYDAGQLSYRSVRIFR